MDNGTSTPNGRASRNFIILATLIAAGILAAVVLYMRTPSKVINVAIMTWGGAGPGYIATEKKFFGEYQVKFHVLDDTKQRQAAYQSKDFEVYLTNPDQHPREISMGMPGKMFMLSDFSFGADGLMSRPDIESVAALRGKRIAYTQGTASDFMLSKALASAGLSRKDVTLVELDDPNTAGVALASGKVDAAISWEPLMSQAVASKQARILFTSRDVPNSIIGVFIAKDSLLKDPARLNRFVSGWLEAVDYYKKFPEESTMIMAKNFKVTKGDMEGMMQGLRLAELKDNQDYFAAATGRPSKMDLFTTEAGLYWKSVDALPQTFQFPERWVPVEANSLYLSRPPKQ
jgi:NitT/TauT family transport system substrate-binding protein